MRSTTRRLLAGLAVGGAALGALGVRRRRVSARVREHVTRVRTASAPIAAEPYHPDDASDLPAPVRRYFERVLPAGQPHVGGVRLGQRGTIRLGGAGSAWHSFAATQTYSVAPPGFVWDAEVAFAPLVSARVLDAYVEGDGLLRATLFGAVPVASAGPDERTTEAELQRYLAETPWFPTALLPAAGVTWTAVDAGAARATIRDGDATASATFHVDDEGYVRRVTADRYRQDVDAVAPWSGRFGAYERHGGMAIPTEAEVGWETADGAVPYWRGRLTDVEYRTGSDTHP